MWLLPSCVQKLLNSLALDGDFQYKIKVSYITEQTKGGKKEEKIRIIRNKILHLTR